MVKVIKRIIKGVDMMGQSIPLLFVEKKKFKTVFGGVMSIICYLLMLVYLNFIINKFNNIETDSITNRSEVENAN